MAKSFDELKERTPTPEKQRDLQILTLQKIVRALGRELQVQAKSSSGVVKPDQWATSPRSRNQIGR